MGCVVIPGAALTVSVTAALVMVPWELVMTQWYCVPLIANVTPVRVSVALVAPETFVQFTPSVETCHWQVGAGLPVTEREKLAFWPAVTDWFAGCVVMAGGAMVTVRVTTLVVTLPCEFVTVQRYCVPSNVPAAAVIVRVFVVVPP